MDSTKQQRYDEWVSRVCSFIAEAGPILNVTCGSFQSRPILDKQPDVVFLGYNPHESGPFIQDDIIRRRFYEGNPDFYSRAKEHWTIWKRFCDSLNWAEYTKPVEDGHFVFFNAIYFGTNNISEFKAKPYSGEAIKKCLQFTGEVIQDIFKPKCVVCFSVPDCFDNLNRYYKFKDVKRINTIQETDASLIEFAIKKEVNGWKTAYTCKRIVKKGTWNGIPVYGIPHPSGRLSPDDFGAIALYLKSEMQKLGI